MKIHDLKIDQQPFADLVSGAKTCEIRNDDRGFEVGDMVRFPGGYTHTISHIQRGYGLPDGLCVLSYAQASAAPDHPLFEMVKDLAEEAHHNGNSWGEWAKPRMDAILSALMCAAPEHESTAAFEECSTCGDRVATLSKCRNIGAMSSPGQQPVFHLQAEPHDLGGVAWRSVKTLRIPPAESLDDEFKLYTHADPSEIERLRALSVENIMIDVVPGADGMGHEVYAKSVADVNSAFGRMVDREEELEQKLAEAQALLRERDRLIVEAYQLADMHLKGDVPNMADRNAHALMVAIEKLPSATAQPAECRGVAINYGLPQGEFQVFGNTVTYPEDPTCGVKTDE